MMAFCIGFMIGGVFGIFISAIVSMSDVDEFEEEDK